jgi:hypothetical protein
VLAVENRAAPPYRLGNYDEQTQANEVGFTRARRAPCRLLRVLFVQAARQRVACSVRGRNCDRRVAHSGRSGSGCRQARIGRGVRVHFGESDWHARCQGRHGFRWHVPSEPSPWDVLPGRDVAEFLNRSPARYTALSRRGTGCRLGRPDQPGRCLLPDEIGQPEPRSRTRIAIRFIDTQNVFLSRDDPIVDERVLSRVRVLPAAQFGLPAGV